MRKQIATEIAHFLDAEVYQVELWDQPLIEYFAAQPTKFQHFAGTDENARNWAWLAARAAIAPVTEKLLRFT